MWYFEERGQSIGPVPEADMPALAQAGRLQRRTLVWRDGLSGWLAAEQTELVTLLPAATALVGAPPPLPPAGYAVAPVVYGTYEDGVRYAGFWIRFAASLLDGVLVQVGLMLLGWLVSAALIQAVLIADRSLEVSNADLALGVAAFAWVLGYHVAFPASRWQATPGKRLLGLRIVRPGGSRVGAWLALGRYLGYFVSSLLLGVGFLMIGWSRQKTALHDVMCRTRVVYARD